ncbi:IS110 family transposase, partial [Xanthomonas vasicola]
CICRTGSARLRAGLYMPALVAMRHNPVVTALKQRLHARGKHGKQIVCAAMRKLLHLAYGVLKSGTAFDPHNALAR